MDPNREQRLREYALTSGELGSSGAQTAIVVLLPLLLAPHAPSAFWIGAVIGAEGLFAILVPYIVGALSDAMPDRLARRYGRRTFFLLLSAPVMVVALAVVPFQNSFLGLALGAIVFFAALHAFITPLRALVLDAVPQRRWGSVQGVLGALHAGGLGYGLVAGGLLFAIWDPLPFLTAAALLVAMTVITYLAQQGHFGAMDESLDASPAEDGAGVALAGAAMRKDEAPSDAPRDQTEFWRTLLRRPGVIWYLVANALWTGAVDGMRPYIFLFAMVVLGITVAESSLVLLALLGGLGIGSVITGRLGDRIGRGRVLLVGVLAMGVVMSAGFFIRSVPVAIAVLAPAGIGAAAMLSLPLPVFAGLVRLDAVGRFTGVFSISRGVPRLVAPLLVGAAVDFGARLMPQTEGYPLMWPVCGAMALLGAFALWRADRAAGRRLL